jgi:hypothetical protein
MFIEVLGHIARLGAEERRRRGPGIRVGLLRVDIGWNLATREEPHLDALAVPQMRENTTSDHVERLPIAPLVRVGESTAPVVASGAGTPIVDNVGLDANVVCGERATLPGMERVRVRFLLVNPLEDVDLTAVRPVGADRPVCGPDAAPVGHFPEIGNEQATVVLLLSRYPDSVGACLESENEK